MRYNTVAIGLMAVVLLVAHVAAIVPYSWRDNTISELGSQGYARAWIMRAGFLGFGSLVLVGAIQRARAQRRWWYREAPLVLYSVGIMLSGIFSTKPFLAGLDYSALEAGLHSLMAMLAGVGISLGVLLYMLTDNSLRRKIVHLAALVLIVAMSALFGMSTTGAGVVQRCLYLVGFAWLIFIEPRPRTAKASA